MSSEEHFEDGKLLAAKSWFTRSSSSRTVQNASIEDAPDEVSSGSSVSKEGAVESGAGFTSLRHQISMRRSMGSGEIKKEAGPGSPSMTVKNLTPLTPFTPLKWKSNLREQEEEEKALECARLGSAISACTINEEHPEAKPAAEVGTEERPAEGQQQGSGPVAEHDRTNPVDKLSTEVQPGNIGEDVSLESLEGRDRKTSSGDDVMVMTIEFLRARLLSERSASKSAKLQIQQLTKKVSELEEKLDQALKDQKKAEVSAQEAFMKLKLAECSNEETNRTIGEVSDRLISTSMKGSPLSRSRVGREDNTHLQQDVSSNKDLSRTNSYGSSIEDRDSSTKGSFSETVNKTEERTADQGRLGVRPAPHDMSERSQQLSQNQECRAAIESRLRNMWSKISEDMTALAEERREDVLRKELISWMSQLPAVLQNIMPKELVSPALDVDLRSESERIGLQAVPRLSVDGQPGLSVETVKDQLHTEAKRAALLHDQFTVKENVQREWERNYQESQQQAKKLTGNTLNGNSSPNGSAGHPELQHADNWNGPNGVVDNSSFLGPHLATLAKSRSTLDLSTRSNGCDLDMDSPQRDEPYVESDAWKGEKPRKQGAEGRLEDPTYQNSPVHGRMALHNTHSKHSRIYQDPSGAPSTRLAEDGYQSSKPDFRAREYFWDDRDRRHSGRHQLARPGHGDTNSPVERNSYYRAGEIEESYSSSQPEESHFDNHDWPAVEDYGLLYQQPELSPGLQRRQSYSGYPAAVAADPRRTSLDRSRNDLRFVDERMYRANELRRNSFAATKVDDAPGQQLKSTTMSRNGDPITEPTLSLGYGPAYDAPPREYSPVQQSPKAGLDKNISDVLRALQLAKAKIQNGGASSMGQRLMGGGPYYLIGRALGPEVGVSIGLCFFLGNAVAGSLPGRERVSPSSKPGYGIEPPNQHMQ